MASLEFETSSTMIFCITVLEDLAVGLANFRWYLPNKIGGGSKPCYTDDVMWLRMMRFSAVVSLEDVNDAVLRLLGEGGIAYLRMPVELDEHDDDAIIEPPESEIFTVARFVQATLDAGGRVYIHCSAGIRRTPFVAERVVRLLTPHHP